MFPTAVNHSVRNAYAVQKKRGGISLSCCKGRMDIRVVFQTQTRRCFVDNDISVYGPRSKVQGFVKKSLLRHNFAAQISKHIDQSLHSMQCLQKRLSIQRKFWFSFLRFARENSHRADLDLPNSSEIQIEIASNLELPPKSICPYKYNNLWHAFQIRWLLTLPISYFLFNPDY